MKQKEQLSLGSADIVQEVSDYLVARFRESIALIILYGSEARGEAHTDSDVDLMVVLRSNDQPLQDAVREAVYEVMWKRDFDRLVSVYLLAHDDYITQVQRGWSFMTSVQQDGVILWNAA